MRSGFLTQSDFEFAWNHLEKIIPSEGSKEGKGMVKRKEKLPDDYDRDTSIRKRRETIAKEV